MVSDFTPEVEDKKGIKSIPIIGETADNLIPKDDSTKKDEGILDDIPILGDVTKELTPETQSEQGLEAVPFIGDINKNLNPNDEIQKEGKSEAHPVGDLFLENKSGESEKKGKSFEILPSNDDDVDSETKSSKNTENDPIDNDEDQTSPSSIQEAIPLDQNDKSDEEFHKNSDDKSHHSTLSSLLKDNSHSHDMHSEETSHSLFFDNHSPMVTTEEYEAGTEVAVHLPEHHSMKNDSMADKIVSKHIEDSSESSSDMDSGVSKIELTNVTHNSDENHTTFQTADSTADSSLFGATADTNAIATSLDTKTVNTEVNKIKFQHARSGSMRFGDLMVLIWVFLYL